MFYFDLWNGILKNYIDIFNQTPPICLNANFCPKFRVLKFGIKNVLFGCFLYQY